MRIELKPMDVRDCPEGLDGRTVFAGPDGRSLSVDIPHEHLAEIRAEFQSRSKGPSLLELWSAGAIVDGQYTEVMVEVVDDRARFSLVMVCGGLVWRTLVDPVDALLMGFHLRLPFFICEPSAATAPESEQSPKEVATANSASGVGRASAH